MKRPLTFALLVATAACATLGSSGLGDVDLPTSGVGPFRKLGGLEAPGTAPFLLDDSSAKWRDPGVLSLGGTKVALFAVVDRDVAGTPQPVIVRSHGDDGRAFYGGRGGQKPPVVVAADAAWEGTSVSGPAPLAVGSETWLYYAADGGIGRARSTDGQTFVKDPTPVLANDANHVYRAPSVVRFPSGTFHLFAMDHGDLVELESDDGVRFGSSTVVLSPQPFGTEAGAVFDVLDDPACAVRVTAAGRTHVRVLYTEVIGSVSMIALAARYGDRGALVRADTGPVYSATETQRSPAFVELDGYTLLYVTDVRRTTNYPSLAGAVSPATITLPPALDYPTSP